MKGIVKIVGGVITRVGFGFDSSVDMRIEIRVVSNRTVLPKYSE